MSHSASAAMLNAQALRDLIRTVPDWPAPGIQFRDITPLLQDPIAFRALIGLMAQRYREEGPLRPTVVAGMDARGFILGGALAHELQLGFVPIRKAGKLPFETISESYALEYGTATVEVHTDAVRPGERVLLVDDLVATGGTLEAGYRLIERLGGVVIEATAIIDLPELGGSSRLKRQGLSLNLLMSFEGH